MSRLRIVCKGAPRTDRAARDLAGHLYPIVNDRPAVFSDLEIFAVDDSGGTIPLTNVVRVDWTVQLGGMPARARIYFTDVDVELDAVEDELR